MTSRFSLAMLAGILAASIAVPQAASAQEREIEVYYDEFGRRVVADVWTGEILSIERPRRGLDGRATGGIPPRRGYAEPWTDDDYFADEDFGDRRYDERRVRRDDRRYGRQDRYDQRYPGDEAAVEPEYFPPAPRSPAGAEPPVVRQQLPAAPSEPALSPANPQDQPVVGSKADLSVAKLQVLLDRAGASPGVIDGRMGDNVRKALVAFEEMTGETIDRTNAAALQAALETRGGDAFMDYTITAEDVAGPYVASIPEDYGQKAQLDHMSYTSTREALAERFHMSETYLAELNPGASFNRAGTVIKVARVGANQTVQVERIVADKGRKQVRAYDSSGNLVAAYPATIGSDSTPSPSGTVTVERIALDPEYTYNPRINFKQGDNDRVLRIPPGPNGPVGNVWIALSKPTYGIHGTPEPHKIGKTNSNGCVRLTNWDAKELAKLVRPGVIVQFIE